MLFVVTVMVTVPSELTVLLGRPVRVNEGVRPVRVMVRAAMVVEVTHRGSTLAAAQVLPTDAETTRLARMPSPVPLTATVIE